MFTARYALSPYVTQIRLVFKRLRHDGDSLESIRLQVVMSDVAQIMIFWVSTPCSVMMLRGNVMSPSSVSLGFVHIDTEVNKVIKAQDCKVQFFVSNAGILGIYAVYYRYPSLNDGDTF